MKTLTIKLEPAQENWLEKQATVTKRSKGRVIRDLIAGQQAQEHQSLGADLADLCGSLSGSKNLSTRSLKGYGAR